MSFFIRGKTKLNSNNKRTKNNNNQGKNKKKRKLPEATDEEITSSEDEGITLDGEKHISDSEDENETAQDKKLRLAKIYLQEIERIEIEKLGEEDEVDKGLISKRLKEDYLKEAGKLRTYVAQEYSEEKLGNIQTLKCREQRNTITCLCISSDNKNVFSGSKDGVVVKWNSELRKKIGVIPFVKHNKEIILGHGSKIMSITLSTDDKYLVVGEDSSDIQVWDPENLKHIKTFKGHKKSVTGVIFKKNSHTLYSSSMDRSVKVWNLDEMMYVETLFGHQDMISSLDTLYKDRVVTSGSRDGTLRIWKITEESQLIYNGHSGSIDIVKLINEEFFVSGGEDGQICLWSFMKKKPVYTIKDAHGINEINNEPNWICSIATLVNTDLFATGSYDGVIKFWKLAENFRSAQFLFGIPQVGFVNSLVFTSDGKKLVVSCGRDHRFGRWTTFKDVKNCIKIIPLLKE